MLLIWGLILGGGGEGGRSSTNNLAGASLSTSVTVTMLSSSLAPLHQFWYEDQMTDEQLNTVMITIYESFPSFGRRMVNDYLMTLGERVPRCRFLK